MNFKNYNFCIVSIIRLFVLRELVAYHLRKTFSETFIFRYAFYFDYA